METERFTLNRLMEAALNPPDEGAVNFKMLRMVLKVIIEELDLGEVEAEVPAEDVGRKTRKRRKRKYHRLETSRKPTEGEKKEAENCQREEEKRGERSEAETTEESRRSRSSFSDREEEDEWERELEEHPSPAGGNEASPSPEGSESSSTGKEESSDGDEEWGTDYSSVRSRHRRQREKESSISAGSESGCTGIKRRAMEMWKTAYFSRRLEAVQEGLHKDGVTRGLSKIVSRLSESANETEAKLKLVVTGEELVDFKKEVDGKLARLDLEIKELHRVSAGVEESVNRLLTETETLKEKTGFLEDNTGLYRHKSPEEVDFPALREMFRNFVDEMRPIKEKFQREFETESEQDTSMSEQVTNLRINVRNLIENDKIVTEKFQRLEEDGAKQKEILDILVEANEKGFAPQDKEDFYDMQKRLRQLEIDCRQLGALNDLDLAIATLKAIKVNKSEVEAALSRKAENKVVEVKVDRTEYEKVTGEHCFKLKQLEKDVDYIRENLDVEVRRISDELDNKVHRIDIETLTESVHRRLKDLTFKLKRLGYAVQIETQMPAATRTEAKCLSCGVWTRRLQNSVVKSLPPTVFSKCGQIVDPKQIVSKNIDGILPPSACRHVGRLVGGPLGSNENNGKSPVRGRITPMKIGVGDYA
ncbi:golgin subfamily A member 6-like protein 22 isoform X2 [Centruroides sculpturatus]|uniref:golgin subfamily A member 6-like protein 22 isoform X2 n=1 Tax=Centruroides sculpturatus TaxID=218467 RepID=UPI000C6CF8F1|nr:golgin subfamily A member 6-like protein 22 isoform X2 [Centruroides sculpturatus]